MVDFNNLLVQTRDKLRTETKLRAFSPGSIARGILDVYNTVANDINFSLDLKIINSLISSAVDEDLDILGKMMGVDREAFSYALGQIKISIDSIYGKTLEDLKDIIEERTGIKPDNIIIPAGTEISNENSTVRYNTTADIAISDDPVYVDGLAGGVGVAGNISSGVLNKITTAPGDAVYITDFLTVTNPIPIDNGADDESDDNYRFRIINAFTESAKGNDMAIRLSALSVPGVADVMIRNYEYGIGSTGVFVVSESPIVSQGILNAVQAAVNTVKSSGETITTSAPEYRGFKITVILQFTANTPVGDKDTVTEQVQENIIDYINNLEMGEGIVINEMRQIIQETSDYIYDHEMVKIGIGDYNFETGLIDYFEPSLAVNQPIGEIEKHICNKKLCLVCY